MVRLNTIKIQVLDFGLQEFFLGRRGFEMGFQGVILIFFLNFLYFKEKSLCLLKHL